MLGILTQWALVALGGAQVAGGRLARATAAQSTVEYALIGALIVVVASAAVGLLGTGVTAVFEHMTSALRVGAAR